MLLCPSTVTNRASVACKDINFESASDVFALAMCSSLQILFRVHFCCKLMDSFKAYQRPREMKTKSMGGVSKKVIGLVSSCMAMEAITTATE